MTSNFDILSLILPIVMSIGLFYLGMIYKDYKTKKSHVREKAKSIDSELIPILNRKIKELDAYLDEKAYIKFDKLQSKPILKLNPNHFIDVVKSCNIFRIVGDKIILVYTKDKNLKRHMTIILSHLNDYHTSACKLEKLIESLNGSKLPESFIRIVNEISISEFGQNRVNALSPKNEDIFALYFLSLTGSQNSYKKGAVFVIDLLEKRFDDLQSAINDSEHKDTFNIIQTEIKNIKVSLTDASDEIQKLHEMWLNKLII